MSTLRHREPGWADVLEDHVDWRTSHRLIAQLGACEAAALAFCRLLERWARGDAAPSTAGARQAALRHAADRVETALTGLDGPLNRYLLELEADRAEGRSWYGGPGAGELIEWAPVLKRAGVAASPIRVAQAYLELAQRRLRDLVTVCCKAHLGVRPGDDDDLVLAGGIDEDQGNPRRLVELVDIEIDAGLAQSRECLLRGEVAAHGADHLNVRTKPCGGDGLVRAFPTGDAFQRRAADRLSRAWKPVNARH